MRQLLIVIVALILVVQVGASAHAEARLALVIGNSAYQSTTPLANPLNDARDMAAALRTAGFSVIEALDADKHKFDGALRDFADQLSRADVALFFYAGLGLQVGLQNYLVPIDAKLERERDLEFEAVKLEFVLRQMEIDREGKTTIVILDACRDNPLARNLARTMGTRSAAVGRASPQHRPASAPSSRIPLSPATSRWTAMAAIRLSPPRWSSTWVQEDAICRP